MLKHKIKYTTYDDPPEEVEEEFYFNVTKTELLELEIEHKEGLEEWVNKVVRAKDAKTLWAEFKRIVLLAYGEKSPDGKSFVKTAEIREAFSHTAAFDALMMSLVSDAETASTFVNGVIPKDLATAAEVEAAKAKAKDAPTE
jgi:hypothetical protein